MSARESEPVVLPPPAPAPVAPLVDDLPRLTPSLLPRGTFAIAVVDAGTLTLPAPTESERAQAMVSTLARETLGRGKVDRGLVHPYYAQLGKVLIRTWDADRAVSRSGLKGFAEQFVENSKTWNAIWQSRAEQFGKTGTPSANETQGRRAPTNDRLGADLAARREIQKEMAAQFRTTRRALVRVTQRADGTLASVDLVAPSMDPQVDREALLDVRAAAQQLPTPPPEVLRGRETLTSLWELELVISISPPVPTFTFEFDEVLGYVDPRLPLDRRIYKKVRLVEVD
ncbi:MAG: energy transducer TonB [Myxococcaceae bacterium]|nr:energy transducer TonB [Myxococcaceae bacterium]